MHRLPPRGDCLLSARPWPQVSTWHLRPSANNQVKRAGSAADRAFGVLHSAAVGEPTRPMRHDAQVGDAILVAMVLSIFCARVEGNAALDAPIQATMPLALQGLLGGGKGLLTAWLDSHGCLDGSAPRLALAKETPGNAACSPRSLLGVPANRRAAFASPADHSNGQPRSRVQHQRPSSDAASRPCPPASFREKNSLEATRGAVHRDAVLFSDKVEGRLPLDLLSGGGLARQRHGARSLLLADWAYGSCV